MNIRKRIIYQLLITIMVLGPAAWAECPINTPGDLNGDCKVNQEDFAILAAHWLQDGNLPSALPVLKILQSGITETQAGMLAEQLKIPASLMAFDGGEMVFVDPVNVLKIPTGPVTDPILIEQLTKESEVPRGGELGFEALNVEGLAKIQAIPTQDAINEILIALQKADISLGEGAAMGDGSVFELRNTAGALLLPAVQLDTRVAFQQFFGSIPVIGPGAQFSARLGPDGQTTQLHIARRLMEAGEQVPLLTPQTAAVRAFAASSGQFIPEGEARLVYFAPSLMHKNTQFLVPHYDLGGIAFGAEGQQANKLRKLVPAVDDLRLVPQLTLNASAQGNLVLATASVKGGTGPYSYRWFSSSVDLSQYPSDASSIEYYAIPRGQVGPEIVTVQVTDDNGIAVEASQTLQIQFLLQTPAGKVGPLTASVFDFGTERGVSDLCAANQAGFINRFLADGVQPRFNWACGSAWEDDFKQPPAGNDTTYVDNADIVFYCGHGYGGGFTFESNIDDDYLTSADAAGAWGNGDLEWLALLSCQVLRDTYNGQSWATRWGPAFDGLHLMLGFQTNAYDWSGFGGRFADWTLGRDFFIFKLPPLPVRAAWCQAKAEQQPASVEAVVMGVVGPGWVISGWNDYVWGKGPVSADIRDGNIQAYWRIVYK
ncbi:MAG: DUF6345 domain-containing protein [Anaerohalosphaeraceae bacterium]